MYNRIICIIILLFLFSCQTNKKRLAFYDSTDVEVNEDIGTNTFASNVYYDSGSLVSIPFIDKGGVKFVNVSVNGFNFEMIFDTGCSNTLISIAEANYLYQKGFLSEDDYLGSAKSMIANGDIVEDMMFNLKEVVLDNKILCTNVVATVSSNTKAPLLLGNEVLNRVASYTIDNERKVINFRLK